MRHQKSFNHLGRQASHRKAMLANMAASLILHKRIETTTAKAKALRMYIEPLLTKSKDDSTNARRVVFSYLQNKFAVTELFREVSPKIASRPGGYTRILKTGSRLGDNADMCIIELVDYNENLLSVKESGDKKSRRRRGSKKKETETSTAEAKVKVEENVTKDEVNKDGADVAETDAVQTKVAEDALVTEATVEEAEEEKANESSVKNEDPELKAEKKEKQEDKKDDSEDKTE